MARRSQGGRRRGARRSRERSPKGWYTRGYLPHYDEGGALQMITYRLGDSLPQNVLEEMEETLVLLPEGKRESVRRQRIEEWLDAGQGSCVLGRPEAARCVVDTWRHFDMVRYGLVAGVVMPNHVHVLIKLMDGFSLGKVVQSWKSYTGRRIAGMMGDCRAGAQRSQEGKDGRDGGRPPREFGCGIIGIGIYGMRNILAPLLSISI